MATAEELVESVQAIIQDPSYTIDEILPLINEGLQMMSADILLTPLDTRATVNTVAGANVANLPSNYGQGIYAAMDGETDLDVYESWTEMCRDFVDLTQAGSVSAVATKDATLMYLPIPAEVTPITIYYYRTPTILVEGAEPDGFNKQTRFYGEAALKYYAIFRIFDEIEDGIEGPKINTSRWENRYEKSISKLKLIVKKGLKRPTFPSNKVWS